MAIGTGVRWLELRVARLLAARGSSPLILAGTLALAGLGGAALSAPAAQPAPRPAVGAQYLLIGSPHTFCYAAQDGTGHTICHILAGQVNTVPNLGCTADPDGDGTFICTYASDPEATN